MPATGDGTVTPPELATPLLRWLPNGRILFTETVDSSVALSTLNPAVNEIEVLEGLKVGDQVLLSDMSAYDGQDRIELK